MFIKFFLIQKSKSSTNLNPKEEKRRTNYRLKYYDFWFFRKKYLRCNSSLGKFSWERGGKQFSSGPNVRGAIMQVTNNPKGSFLWGQLARGTLSGVYYLRGIRPRANYPEGNYPGGNFPRGQLSQHRSIVFPEKLQKIKKKTTLMESVLETFSRQKAANLQKKTSMVDVFVEFWDIFPETLFCRTPDKSCFWKQVGPCRAQPQYY